jgi:hypothetical protein
MGLENFIETWSREDVPEEYRVLFFAPLHGNAPDFSTPLPEIRVPASLPEIRVHSEKA